MDGLQLKWKLTIRTTMEESSLQRYLDNAYVLSQYVAITTALGIKG